MRAAPGMRPGDGSTPPRSPQRPSSNPMRRMEEDRLCAHFGPYVNIAKSDIRSHRRFQREIRRRSARARLARDAIGDSASQGGRLRRPAGYTAPTGLHIRQQRPTSGNTTGCLTPLSSSLPKRNSVIDGPRSVDPEMPVIGGAIDAPLGSLVFDWVGEWGGRGVPRPYPN